MKNVIFIWSKWIYLADHWALLSSLCAWLENFGRSIFMSDQIYPVFIIHDQAHPSLTESECKKLCTRLEISHFSSCFKLGRQGNDRPRGIVWWRRPSHTGQENPRTSAPPLHSGTVAHVRRPRPGPGLRPVLWPWDRRGDFFNHNLKFAPTGSRTQDLRSAAGFL